jgi:tight adherence protein C
VLLVGIVAIALAIVIVVYLIGAPSRPAETTVAAGEVAVVSPVGPPVPRSGDPNAPLPPLYRRFAKFASRFTPASYGKQLRRKLDLAGNPPSMSPDRVLAFKGVGLVLGVVLGALIGLKHGVGVLIFPVIGGAVGFFLPDVWIRNLGEHRQQNLVLGLPDAIDMMTVCVEAGLGFDSSLARVARTLTGPMAEECARVLQEMQFGMSRSDALRALADRTAVPELRVFVSSIVQSSELGISVGDVLREQAREMRVRRRQRAEEKAQKLPVKILFPLLFCLLPAMFVVVLGPAAIRVIHTLSGLSH